MVEVYEGVDDTMARPFEGWVVEARPRLERAFLARYGVEIAGELTAEVMAWAWEHRGELEAMSNPVGYLYRVGQSKARRLVRWRASTIALPPEQVADSGSPEFEPGLEVALVKLSDDQRTAVILVHCFGWTQPGVAELLDIELHTVRNRVHRGLAALRRELGADI